MRVPSRSEILRKRIQRKLARLGESNFFVAGSLEKIWRRCGNPRCRCILEGEKHPAFLLSSKVNGKSKVIYVPVALVKDVRRWSKEYAAVKRRLKGISALCEQLIRLHVSEKRSCSK